MLGGVPLIDAHVHAARLPTLKDTWKEWAKRYGTPALFDLYDEDGTLVPRRFDEYMAGQRLPQREQVLARCAVGGRAEAVQERRDAAQLGREAGR